MQSKSWEINLGEEYSNSVVKYACGTLDMAFNWFGYFDEIHTFAPAVFQRYGTFGMLSAGLVFRFALNNFNNPSLALSSNLLRISSMRIISA